MLHVTYLIEFSRVGSKLSLEHNFICSHDNSFIHSLFHVSFVTEYVCIRDEANSLRNQPLYLKFMKLFWQCFAKVEYNRGIDNLYYFQQQRNKWNISYFVRLIVLCLYCLIRNLKVHRMFIKIIYFIKCNKI